MGTSISSTRIIGLSSFNSGSSPAYLRVLRDVRLEVVLRFLLLSAMLRFAFAASQETVYSTLLSITLPSTKLTLKFPYCTSLSLRRLVFTSRKTSASRALLYFKFCHFSDFSVLLGYNITSKIHFKHIRLRF